ncbi:MAG: MmcB family DNA repair protein [Rhodospirillales bacterium]
MKSGPVDFLTDSKWPEYREFSDALFFAVHADFPLALLPLDVGVIVTADDEAALLREAPAHPTRTGAAAGPAASFRLVIGLPPGEYAGPAGCVRPELRVGA